MLSDENLRFVQLVESLKEQGQLADYVQLAAILETNKAGISDIRAGRKKISIDLLRRLKNSYPLVSLDWVIMGVGEMYSTISTAVQSAPNDQLLERVIAQAEEIGRLRQMVDQLTAELQKSVQDVPEPRSANVG